MRKLTKSIFGVVSLGVLASSYSIGLANQVASPLAAASEVPVTDESLVTDVPQVEAGEEKFETDDSEAGDQLEVTEGAEETEPSSTPSASATSTPTATPSATPSSTKTATPKASATPAPVKATPIPVPTGAKGTSPGMGDQIYYRYGSIQLQVTKSGGSLTDVKIITATTRGREWAEVPAQLAAAALAANGTGFANVSGATFTSDAFRSALESALAKL